MSSRPTDLDALEILALDLDVEARNPETSPLRNQLRAQERDLLRSAVAEIRELRLALAKPVPELAKTTALVLYFPDQAAADGFEKLVTEAMPGLKARTLR